ncbi:rap guanine nucleotide exchange factor 5 [Egretta garzetta]|uniref:rap guanine nucleotide exchange factor 5 n=1 Tax=Egretta garzetta TaxID=188379 RepID=UPI00163BC5EB|nr:rap guanine nucleotide exchange factor 5 [Egretta garzetta]
MPGAVVSTGITGISLLMTLSRRISNPYLETPSKIYGESSSCAGRALRNIFTLQASDLIKDRVYLTGICRRSCVGSELVDWLLEQCPFVKCRSTAVGVWQLLLDMGIILSVDRQLYFQDAHAFYQFSADECTYLFCEFEKEEGWKNGVKLLLQLLPLSPPRIDMCNLPDQKIEDTAETNAEILARLTSAVQRELAAVIALKARKSAIHQNEENSSQEIRGLGELKDTSDAQAGVLCKLQARDDIGRIELVQKLARENCQFLQADRKPPEKAEQLLKYAGNKKITAGEMEDYNYTSVFLSPCIAFIHVFDTLNDVTEPGQNERNGNCGLLLALKQLPLLCRSPWGDGICQGDLAGGCQQLFGSRWVSMPPARSAAAPHRRRRWLSRRWLLRGGGLPVQERMIYIDEEDEEDEWSSRSQSSTEDDSGDSLLSDRYVVVSGTPEKILEHLLSDLHLEAAQDKETETLLDDFLLTYTVFMTTDDLCQALLRHYCAKNHQGKEDDSDVSCRKRKVLHLVSQWTSLYKDWLHEDEHLKQFLKTIYRNVLDDVYEYPILEKELKEFQKILGMHRRHTVDEYSPHRKNKTFYHQFSLKENWLQHRGAMSETEEIFCRVYITEHSYVSVKAQVSTSAQEILKIVAEKIQYPEEELALVTVAFSGEKHELQPNDLAISKSFESSSRMFVYRKDLTDSLNPFAENEELQQRSVRILGINTWDLALELTNFDWSLFNAIHEQELIYFTFSRQGSAENTENLSLLLQRCNEVQLWVATEILLCSQLCKRVQLVKKFIKIAAHCKAQRNLNSFFAIVMGLNTASVSRLSQTWEKIPGKFKKLFTELESLTDPSLNHKAYRDAFKKMKSPKIPFMPLLLKDVTFIHEGNKTFLDNLVNFEKLHMIADTVRSLRHCRNNQFGNEVPSKEHHELKPYVHHLHVIDNQQALFELSHRIEPRV